MRSGQTGQMGQMGQMDLTALHPLIANSIERYDAELVVRPEPGIRILYSATLMIPRGQTFVGRADRVEGAMQALEGALMMEGAQ